MPHAQPPGLRHPTPEYLAGLPTDPAQLLALLRRTAKAEGNTKWSTDKIVFQIVGDLFAQADPILPAALRAGLYRALALIPGIQRIAGQTDFGGRRGVAVGFAEGGQRQDILLDPGHPAPDRRPCRPARRPHEQPRRRPVVEHLHLRRRGRTRQDQLTPPPSNPTEGVTVPTARRRAAPIIVSTAGLAATLQLAGAAPAAATDPAGPTGWTSEPLPVADASLFNGIRLDQHTTWACGVRAPAHG